MKHKKLQKALLVLSLSMSIFIPASPTLTEATTQSVSPLVAKIQQSSKPVTKNSAKPASQIKILVNNTPQTLTDPIIMDNGRVFLPVRALGDLLNIQINYLDTYKVATASNSISYLELPLGYNKAVKDKTLTLPIDTNKKDTRIITHNNRTYLPVRFIAENLGYNIEYAYQTVSITTDGSIPILPSKPEKPKEEPVKPAPEKSVESPEFKVPSGIPSGATLIKSVPEYKYHEFSYNKSLPDGGKINTISTEWGEGYSKPAGDVIGVDKNGKRFIMSYNKNGGLLFTHSSPDINQESLDVAKSVMDSLFSAYGY